ncbi:MAG: TrkH family potassium uptake protein [Clostridiaceae bacterium]|nr:TrkH family potassium uptake protein [Clostridiaceae bacterium]
MNYSIVRFILGRTLLIEAALLCAPLLIAIIYQEGIADIGAFLITIVVVFAIGALMSFRRPKVSDFYAREGFMMVTLTWFLLSLFGAMPFLISGSIASPVDAFFETVSGFTTTGASILNDVEVLSRSMLFWRSLTHLIGGMGVLVFALAILPKVESEAVHIMRAEVPGPTFGKLMARVSQTARILYKIYLVMTGVLILVLIVFGMPVYDSFIHAFGAAGTGGFSIYNASIAHYGKPALEIILGIAMLLFGVNFYLYYLIMLRQVKTALKNEELRWFFSIVAAAVIMISLIVLPSYENIATAFRDVFFTVSSLISTTGYVTVDFANWPMSAHVILLFLMFCGSMAGSTGGGIKVSRIAIIVKTVFQDIRHAISPNRRIVVTFENKPLSSSLQQSVSVYFMTYIIFFAFCLLTVSFDSPTFITAFSAVAATFNNIGPGMDAVGPTSNYSDFSNWTKMVLSLAMVAGRLEIYPVLVLLSPKTWRKL